MRRHEREGLFKHDVQRIANSRSAMVVDEYEREHLLIWLRDERRYIALRSRGYMPMDATCKAEYIKNWKRNLVRLHALQPVMLP